jgi:hypothetical protein
MMGESMDRSNNPFITQTTFGDLFPDLDDVLVEGTIGESPYDRSTIRFSIRQRGGVVRCPNSKCWGGGFVVDFPAGEMQREGLTEKNIRIRCLGRENSDKGRRSGNSCGYSMEGIITFKAKALPHQSVE